MNSSKISVRSFSKKFKKNIINRYTNKPLTVNCMIPARLGSQRVKNKNIKLLNGKPFLTYVLKSISKSEKIFDNIYINSESKKLKKYAEDFNLNFYLRNKKLSSNKSTNDEFAYDFMKNIHSDYLVQILPTSPFLTSNEIFEFFQYLIKHKPDTLISVTNHQIACVYKNKAINFRKNKKNPPSQNMKPVQSYATCLMAWKCSKFKKNYEKFRSAYHGPSGKTLYYELKGLSTLDIDTMSDFKLVESIMKNSFN